MTIFLIGASGNPFLGRMARFPVIVPDHACLDMDRSHITLPHPFLGSRTDYFCIVFPSYVRLENGWLPHRHHWSHNISRVCSNHTRATPFVVPSMFVFTSMLGWPQRHIFMSYNLFSLWQCSREPHFIKRENNKIPRSLQKSYGTINL